MDLITITVDLESDDVMCYHGPVLGNMKSSEKQ